MKLQRLYCDQPELFGPIDFHEGLNVVLGEIRQPLRSELDTHNLGKSLLARVIDYCLLKQKNKREFPFAQEALRAFVFFLEVRVQTGGHVTIRRAVDPGSKVSFMRHQDARQDFSTVDDDSWHHANVAFEKAKELLDGYLGLHAASPWAFRNVVGFSLRSQKDYDEPFKLAKYAGRHAEWKPLLGHILGLDGQVFQDHYDTALDVASKVAEESRLVVELQGLDNKDRLRSLIQIQEREITRYQTALDAYNFELADKEIDRGLLEELEGEIAQLNSERFYYGSAKRRTEEALGQEVKVDLKGIRSVFEQARVYFGGQIVKEFEDLIAFNKAISAERTSYLREELAEIEGSLAMIGSKLTDLNQKRAEALALLRDVETFEKYKQLSQEMVGRRAKLERLRLQFSAVDELDQVRGELADLRHRQDDLAQKLRDTIDGAGERYAAIRARFDEIILAVVNVHAALYTRINDSGNPEFQVELLDAEGQPTQQSEGNTYGRLLCVAFDMAVQYAYRDDAFPHFVYHDGVLETLDKRKKLNLIEVMRSQAATGLQQIITVIDSELPELPDGTTFAFEDHEIVLTLHDEGRTGRLFRMPAW